MRISASQLRANIYRILDQVLDTGIPVEIERNGKLVRIEPVPAPSKLDRLEARPYFASDPEEIVHMDWSAEWRP